jgi:hypothetical protein
VRPEAAGGWPGAIRGLAVMGSKWFWKG